MGKIKIISLVNAEGKELLTVKLESIDIDVEGLSGVMEAVRSILDKKSDLVQLKLERNVVSVYRLDDSHSVVILSSEPVEHRLIDKIKRDYELVKGDLERLKSRWMSILTGKKEFSHALEEMWG